MYKHQPSHGFVFYNAFSVTDLPGRLLIGLTYLSVFFSFISWGEIREENCRRCTPILLQTSHDDGSPVSPSVTVLTVRVYTLLGGGI